MAIFSWVLQAIVLENSIALSIFWLWIADGIFLVALSFMFSEAL